MADSSYYEEDEDINTWDQAEQRVGEAFELYETGLMQQALDKLNEAISLNPGCSAWHFNMGLTLDGLDRYEEALVCYQHAIELSPDDVEILNCLAVDYTRTTQYDLALSIFERIEKLDPSFEPAYCNRIITYTEMEQYDKAEQMFYLAQELNPDCPICFYNIGNALFTRGLYARAVWCWEKTAKLEPTHPQINYRIAQACWADGQDDKAKEFFLEALRQNPGSPEILLDYGIFLLEKEHLRKAEEKFNWILELEPDYAPAMFYQGEICRIEGDFKNASYWYRKAIRADQKLAGPRFCLARILLWQKQPDEVTDLLKEELQLSCDDQQVLLLTGQMLLNLGECDQAVNCFLRVLDANPEQGQAYFGIATVLMQKHDAEGCVQFLEHAIGLDIGIKAAYTCAAMIYCNQKNFQRAAEVIERAKAVTGNNWNLRLWTAKITLQSLSQKTLETLANSLPRIF
jgi:tetratricopeptide (TPR) repeat protein